MSAHRSVYLRLALIVSITGCSQAVDVEQTSEESALVTFSGPTMGTAYSVRLYDASGELAPKDWQVPVDARLAELNHLMSTYDSESELSRFNKSKSTDWYPVSIETAKVVQFALAVAERSSGAFDPTVGPVVNLWGFGPDGRRRDPPADSEIEKVKSRTGYRKVSVRQDPPSLRKAESALYLDLSAIAKGYAADQVSALLEQLSADSSMVEIGGEVVCSGTKPGGEVWRIGLERPSPQGRALQLVLGLRDEAVATSGDYRNFFEQDGIRYSHTIDPTSARPVTHGLATVTVGANSCMEADALATAILVMGPKIGYDWAEEESIAAYLVEHSEGGFSEKMTSAWKQKMYEVQP